MMHQHLEDDSTAHRIAHYPSLRKLQVVQQCDRVGAHMREPIVGDVVRLVAMPMTAHVVSDDAPSPREPRDHPGLYPILLGARTEAMNQEHGRAVALVEVVNPYAVGMEEGHRGNNLLPSNL